MNVEQAENPERWNRFVEEQSGPIFSRWEWSEICASYGHDIQNLVAKNDGEIVGVLPLVEVNSSLFGHKLVSMPFCEYGGPITRESDHNVAEQLGEKVHQIANRNEVDFVSLRNTVADIADRYEAKERFVNFQLTLDDIDEVWDGFESRLRRGIRKAEDENIEIQICSSEDDLRQFYDLFLETMRGHGSPPHSFAFFKEIWTSFDTDQFRVFLAFYEGKLVNGIAVFKWADKALYWSGASDIEYRDLNGGSLALWEAIQWAHDMGCLKFDLGRTREGSGVYMYKKGFGGEKIWMQDYHYLTEGAELPNPEDDKYELPMKVWKRLPMKLTEILGPPIRKNITL